jgi:hypothetical protein
MFYTKNRKIRKILRYDALILKKIEKLFKRKKRKNLNKFLKLKKKFDPKYMKKIEDRNLLKSMHHFIKGFNKRKFIKNKKQLNNEFINSYSYNKNKKFNRKKPRVRRTKRHIITEYSHFLQNLIFYLF